MERRKKRPFSGKIGPYKQRQEERYETEEIENYDESETNNNDQPNEHTIIVPDNFFLHGQGATKAKQRKN